MSETTHPIDPRRGSPPVLCRWCGAEIEAYEHVTVSGLDAGHHWRHCDDGGVLCDRQTPPTVAPYDHFAADRALNAFAAHPDTREDQQ